jgi:hypothetical protein
VIGTTTGRFGPMQFVLIKAQKLRRKNSVDSTHATYLPERETSDNLARQKHLGEIYQANQGGD